LERFEDMNLSLNRNIEAFDKGFRGETVSVKLLSFAKVISHGRIDSPVKQSGAGDNGADDHHNAGSGVTHGLTASDVFQFRMRQLMGDNKGDSAIVVIKDAFSKVYSVLIINPCVDLFVRMDEKPGRLPVFGKFQTPMCLLIYG